MSVVQPICVMPGNARYPARLRERLGEQAPPQLWALGNLSLPRERKTALFCSAAQTGWKRQLTCFKQSCTVKDLAGGRKYWFRVAASNAHGQGPWSQPVCVRVK